MTHVLHAYVVRTERESERTSRRLDHGEERGDSKDTNVEVDVDVYSQDRRRKVSGRD